MAEGPSVLLASPVAGIVLKGSGIVARRFIRWCGQEAASERRVDHWLYLLGFFLYALQKGI